MTKQEKRVVGSYYPLQVKNSSNLTNDSFSLSSEKVRRVRHVVIEEETPVREISVPKLSASPQQYLETKKQIEILHEKYGESWLNSQSGLLVQNVLGLERSLPVSSSPYEADFTIYSGEFFNSDREIVRSSKEEPTVDNIDNINDEYERNDVTPDTTQEDMDVEEESIYVATISGEMEPIFIVIGQTHLSEKESSTGSEKERWHIDSIISCEIIDDSTTVQVDFETMRKDRKQRIYVFEEEIEAFVACIKNKLNSRLPKEGNDVKYQCMKCSTLFVKIRNKSILGEPAVKCPNCDSTLVVEEV
ncbi:hypothetical protein BDFB_000523 [Asbolus verrucosus]|uniref:Uncharacterized protein n=1 Tax=Asbolus verrucosus TaxID=1661398 RepID=A0A482VS01_ASBVE|nr:hypothetical protein BDFB_000523 [Asbolus verrucosus]